MLTVETPVPGRQVRVHGDVDVLSVADLRAALAAAVDAPPADDPTADLVLDCRGLRLVDATGLGVLLAAHRRAARAGRRLVLDAVPEPLARLLFVSRLSRVLHVQACLLPEPRVAGGADAPGRAAPAA